MVAERYGDIAARLDDHVALLEIRRPPHNFFDHQLIVEPVDPADERLVLIIDRPGSDTVVVPPLHKDHDHSPQYEFRRYR